MRCSHCNGKHASDYCPGYNFSSLRKTAEEIRDDVESLAAHNEEGLQELSEQLEASRQANEELKEGLDTAADQISSAVSEGTNAVTSGLDKVDDNLQTGFSHVVGAVVTSGTMVYQGLVGIGALISFREQMDQLRHEERLKFDEEASVAGSARRELRTAAVMMSVGDLEQAYHHVKRSLDTFSASAETFRLRSIIESRWGKHDAAITSLRAALKLAETGDLLPNIQNLNRTVAKNSKGRIEVSGASQLALELNLVGKEIEALEVLSNYVGIFPSDGGLQVIRVRTLAKTPRWDALKEQFIAGLVDTAPEQFNVLFVDPQLGAKLPDAQGILRRIFSSRAQQVEERKRALMIVSKGESGLVTSAEMLDTSNFLSVARTLRKLSEEIENYAAR